MSTGDTKTSRYQTQHMGESFASPVFVQRGDSARLTGGGVLLWTVTGTVGVFRWYSDLYIEFPSLGGCAIRLVSDNSSVGGSAAYGEVTAVAEGSSICLAVPYITTDDVSSGATWNTTTTPIYDIDQTDLIVSADPLTATGVTSENLFVLGYNAQDNQLFFHNDLVLSSGVPSGFGRGGIAGERVVGTSRTVSVLGYVSSSPYNLYADIGFDYLPAAQTVDVWVNGVLQTAGVAGGGVAGYRNSSIAGDCDYIEVVGTGGSPYYRGIQFQTDRVPAAGEEIIVKANVGNQGPQGPAGPPGGLQDAYNEGQEITLATTGSPTAVQTPVLLSEIIPAAAIGATPPRNLYGDTLVPAIEVRRTPHHPDAAQRDEISAVLDSGGNLGVSGAFLYNGYNYGTLERAMRVGGGGRDGVFFVGMSDHVGAADKDGKMFCRFITATELEGSGPGAGDSASALQYFKQLSSVLAPRMVSGALEGQFAVNANGEVAAGWGKDFVRWHTLELLLSAGGSLADTNTVTYALSTAIIENSAKFLGGTATAPYASSPEIQEFFHANPTTAYVGANLYELKLALDDDGTDRNLRVTYGRYLDGHTVRILLFFSSESVFTGEEIP